MWCFRQAGMKLFPLALETLQSCLATATRRTPTKLAKSPDIRHTGWFNRTMMCEEGSSMLFCTGNQK